MTLRDEWLKHAVTLSSSRADFFDRSKKILQTRVLRFRNPLGELNMSEVGYKKSKLTMLTSNYLHTESHRIAQELWERRRLKDKYGSVGFTTYNHHIKGGAIDAVRNKKASVFGPCIQSVVLTLGEKRDVSIDVFYRTTEFYKKFPADLVFIRDVLLRGFQLTPQEVTVANMHFANITCNPMYFVILLTLVPDPLSTLRLVERNDHFFFKGVVKWTARHLCPEHSRGIQKFAQARRVSRYAVKSLGEQKLQKIQKFLRDNHPGYSNDYRGEEGDSEC